MLGTHGLAKIHPINLSIVIQQSCVPPSSAARLRGLGNGALGETRGTFTVSSIPSCTEELRKLCPAPGHIF